jgi:hypothetical protein
MNDPPQHNLNSAEKRAFVPDCFISHSATDATFAKAVYEQIKSHNLTCFLAPVSLEPGAAWSPTILTSLRESSWVVFLASKAACSSPFVQQEVGGAIVSGKHVIPIVWDMPPCELPAWARDLQAIDIRGAAVGVVSSQVASIAKRIRGDKDKGAIIVAAAIAALLLLLVASGNGK